MFFNIIPPKYLISKTAYNLQSVKLVDENVFSDSDIEALDFIWNKFSHLKRYQFADLTHKYPKWKKHEQALNLNCRIQMDPEDFFNDPDSDVEKCFELNEQDRATRREHLAEMIALGFLWS